jgi:ribosomal protein L40E
MASNRPAAARHCVRCNIELPAHATFCRACGERHARPPAAVAKQCRNAACRHMNSRHVRYCTACGDSMASTGRA